MNEILLPHFLFFGKCLTLSNIKVFKVPKYKTASFNYYSVWRQTEWNSHSCILDFIHSHHLHRKLFHCTVKTMSVLYSVRRLTRQNHKNVKPQSNCHVEFLVIKNIVIP